MTFTATQIRLPASVQVRTGQIVRFNALGRFMKVEDRVTNGLGTLYIANKDGTFSRYFF
jgi:hypothetical protein